MRAKKEIKQLDNGKWSYGGLEFASEESAKLFAYRGAVAASGAALDPKRHSGWLLGISVVVLSALGWWLTGVIGDKASSNNAYYGAPVQAAVSNASSYINSTNALYKCQQAIKAASNDAGRTSVPYVPNVGSGSEYYFAWNNSSKLVRAPNGLGIEVGATASCIVDGSTGKILSLTVQGRSLM